VTPITSWLAEHLASLSLSEEAEGYLLGRGATPEAIQRLGFVEWEPAKTDSPSAQFRTRYKPRGDLLKGTLAYPLRSPTGDLIGFEARGMKEKKISEFRTPEAEWNPVFVNAPEAAQKLWSGGSIWVTEGVFDELALELVIPVEDVAIATLRAGLSKRHVEFISRLCRNRVYMVYDNDETGRKATLGWEDAVTGKYRPGALNLLQRAGLRVIDFRYRGKDPGEVWSSGGIHKLRQAFLGEQR
jgi:DNA primase